MKTSPLADRATISKVNDCLTILLNQSVNNAQFIDPIYKDLVQNISYLIERGGKRLRPLLVLAAYQGMGGKDISLVLPVASSQEIFHAFILMHDDIIDQDTKRWGGLNISGVYLKQFQKQFSTFSTAEQRFLADNYALLAGDICFSMSQTAILDSNIDSSVKVAMLQLIQQTLFTMIGGELLDVATSLPGVQRLTRGQIINISRYKTAAYSFVTPLQLGALAAGGNAWQLTAIANFGNNLGIAYQLKDDILGVFGDSNKTGKAVVSDLQRGKHTLLAEYALRQMTNEQRTVFLQWFRNPEVNETVLKIVQTILRECGALGAVKEELGMYLRAAEAAIPGLPFDEETKNKLRQFVADSQFRTK